MSEKPYEDITVQEVIDRADVGRSTFYAHYPTKQALLDAALGELRAVLASPGGHLLGFSVPLLNHVAEHRALGRALFGPARHSIVALHILTLLEEAIRRDLLQAGPPELPMPLEGYIRFAAGAYLAVVQWWLEQSEPMPPVALDRILRDLVLGAIRSQRPQAAASVA